MKKTLPTMNIIVAKRRPLPSVATLWGFLLILLLSAACQKLEVSDEPTGKGDDDTESELPAKIYTVGELETVSNGTRVNLSGYIVGYVKSSSLKSMVFNAEGAIGTNIVLADSPLEQDYQLCAAVQLPNNSAEREELNLCDHPENIGRSVIVSGMKSIYFKFPGIKNLLSFKWSDEEDEEEPTDTTSLMPTPTISHEAAVVLEGC